MRSLVLLVLIGLAGVLLGALPAERHNVSAIKKVEAKEGC